MELVMQRRTQEFEGYVLEPHGATFGQAIRTRDISIPSYREEMRRQHVVQITQDNGNQHVRGLETSPPSLETCQWLVEELAARRPEAIARMVATIKDEEAEMKDTAMGRDERAFQRVRLKDLRAAVDLMRAEESVTAEDLHNFFRAEHIGLRGQFVPPELRQSLAVLREEQEFARA